MAFQKIKYLTGNLDLNSFLRDVQLMGHRFEVHLAHFEVTVQDALYRVVVDAQHLCDLLLG
jgi:hypothetical protein